MCGIAGFTGREKAVPYLIDCLERLEYRGYDSSGIALQEKNEIKIIRRKGKLCELKKAIFSEDLSESFCGIGHTRWATHGAPDEINAHPHLSEKGMFAVVHNGIIENYEELKKTLVSQGVSFASQTDTEVIAQLFEKNYKGDFLSAAEKTLSVLEGSYAIAVLCRDYPDKIFCARKGSPLVVAFTDKGTLVSSDVLSVVRYSDEVCRLSDGESALVSADKAEFFTCEFTKNEKKPERLTVAEGHCSTEGYRHHMLKEIFQQTETAEKTLSKHLKGDEIYFEGLEELYRRLPQIKRVIFVGCGSAYHVALSAKHVTERFTGIAASAEIASEWRYSHFTPGSDCLAVFISQSGETADTLAALKKAKKGGAITLSVVNVEGSSLSLESDFVIYTAAGPEIAVATTKAYTAQLMTVYLLAMKIGRVRYFLENELYNRLLCEMRKIPKEIALLLEALPEKVKAVADELYTIKQLYFIGRGTDYAAALEGALKLKEISYIPCEAYPAGELKHGTISLIEKGSVVIAVAGNRDVFTKTLSNIKEVKSRGARLVAVGGDELLSSGVLGSDDRAVIVKETEGVLSALYQGIALQLLAYYVALRKKCDIDMPRNLAKSVTVE